MVFIWKFVLENFLFNTRRTSRTTFRWSSTFKLLLIHQSSYFSVNLPIFFIYFYFVKKLNPTTRSIRRTRKHRIREVLQGRSKFKRSNVSSATLFFGICWKTCSHLSIYQKLDHFVVRMLLFFVYIPSIYPSCLSY